MAEQNLTRRECLVRGAGAVLVAGVAAAGGYWLHDRRGGVAFTGDRLTDGAAAPPGLPDFFAQVDFPASSPRISVALGDEACIEQMVRTAVGGLDPARGMGRFVAPGDVVVIKPNVGFDRPPYLGATTHPEVVRCVIRLCREAQAREVIITDNPIEAPEACFAKSGIARVAAEEGARIVVPTEDRFEWVAFRPHKPDAAKGEALHQWPLFAAPLRRATKLIGIAPVKDHNLASASMALKNWYGLLGGRRNQLHQAIHEVISDLALLFSPTLVIADAMRVMMRNGPTGGRITDVKPGGELGRPAVIASVDPVACDAWCYQKLLGRDPARLKYLELASAKIQAVAGGAHRFGEASWQTYERAGKITTASV